MINYASTDSSVDIIRSMCPSWEIVDSRNIEFKASAIDDELFDIESNVSGPRIALNVTEFIYGNFDLLRRIGQDNVPNNLIIPCSVLVAKEYGIDYSYDEPLISQLPWWGVSNSRYRQCRLAHATHQRYRSGRHYWPKNTDELMIYWHGFSPMNDKAMERKLQISFRIPDSDTRGGLGLENKRNRDQWLAAWEIYKIHSNDHAIQPTADLTDEIGRYLTLSDESLRLI